MKNLRKEMNKSTLKTKMRRAGFKLYPILRKRFAWRKCWKYCAKGGRRFRVRWAAGVVDVGEVHETFDRWANSTERVLTIEEFMKEYL